MNKRNLHFLSYKCLTIHLNIQINLLVGRLLKIFIIFVLTTTKETILTSIFFSLFADEVITIDNQSWISIHYYLVATWKHMHVLFTLE